MTEPTEEECASMLRDGELCTNLIECVLSNRAAPVCVFALSNAVSRLAECLSPAAREWLALELDKLAIYIRDMPTEDSQPAQQLK